MKSLLQFLVLLLGAEAVLAEGPVPAMRPAAQVHADGVFSTDLFEGVPDLAKVRVTNAPSVGGSLLVSRDQALAALVASGVPVTSTNWTGPITTRVTRRMRDLEEKEVREMLAAELQRRFSRDRGELELRLSRPWRTVSVADENSEIRIVEAPSQGITPVMSLKFQLKAGDEVLGEWFQSVSAKLWADVFVVPSAVRRGTALPDAEVTEERRDLLSARDALAQMPTNPAAWEFSESLGAGQVLTRRSLRLRTVVSRGKLIDAVVRSGLLEITAKVEALEDGIPGQVIRVRNAQTRKELRGRVEDEGLVRIAL